MWPGRNQHWLDVMARPLNKQKMNGSKCEQHKAYKQQLGLIGRVGERIGKGELPDSASADVQHLRYA